eukprot:XP_010647505.2 PREDICTED: katanin p80 WD40 repeat-containing subunit B1 homolog isoform X1 [Vitis vinifera]
MAKRGYKLQEFVAHTTNVNCLNIGKKACRLLISGGDDHKVNLWAIGKPTSLMSLCGHTSPVESVTFDSAEVLVAAGASTGVIKLWDLEEAKMVRTLTGHRSNCTAVEFHPFGEFFASGSLDTNLKVWDIRKKGCIHTYKGHTRGISTIRFTPDGRWVVSGGFDNVVKVWDLTAGKLLHDFKFHEGHIRSIDFHPLEFLLATGSADRTVKFWDLETFELIGSARPEATGVRSITFHPDGRTLFCGLDDSLKVYSWEPVVCHDAVDMGWSILGDICIHEGKLLGCSYYRNSVGVWVADISQIEPYGSGLLSKKNGCVERKFDLQESHSVEKVGSSVRSTSGLRSMSPDYDTKEIKNIYVDSSGGNSVASQKVRSFNTPKVLFPSDSQEITNLPTQKHSPGVGLHAKTQGRAITRSFVVPSIVTRDNSDGKDLANSRRESITPARANTGMSLKTSHIRRPSNSKYEAERLLMAVESGSFDSMPNDLDSAMKQNFHSRLVVDDEASESWEEKNSNITSVAEKFEKVLSPQASSNQENSNESLNDNKRINSIKIVNGVAVVAGRTRSLVERFERREKFNSNEDQTTNVSSDMMPERQERFNSNEDQTTKVSSEMMPETARTSPMLKGQPQISGRESTAASEENTIEDVIQNHDLFISTLRSRLTKLQVVRHFWEQNDVKGAINALRKLPDHSVQADVVSVLMEKMEILTLDLFSCLLPVLMSLLDSNLERHANLSLDMLLKLVSVFGPVIHSAISAPPAIGVNLQAEHRRECCNQCFIQLQKIQKNLPVIIRRGGLLAKSAQELNLVLQES